MNKPDGKFRCLACGNEWDGESIFLDPSSTAVRWTCGNLICGGMVVRIKEAEKTAVSQEVP